MRVLQLQILIILLITELIFHKLLAPLMQLYYHGQAFFTGLYPFKTGIRSTSFNKLNPDVPTLFKIFETYGYNFYGYVPKIGDIIGLYPNFVNDDSFYEPYKNLYEGNGKSLSNKIFETLENETKEPWFFFVHLYDLHDPVIVHKSFNDEKFGTSTYEKQYPLWIIG